MAAAPRAKKTTKSARAPFGFIVFVYRMPPAPAGRVAVWRQLKKLGANYLQQAVCIFPDTSEVRAELDVVLSRISSAGGTYHLLPLSQVPADEERKLISQFTEQTARHYQEIVDYCEDDFRKEIEFEIFRENYTYEEAEEIRGEYERISAWFDRVRERDWFSAANRREADTKIRRCRRLLEDFEARVYARQMSSNDGRAQREVRAARKPRLKPVPLAHRGRSKVMAISS